LLEGSIIVPALTKRVLVLEPKLIVVVPVPLVENAFDSPAPFVVESSVIFPNTFTVEPFLILVSAAGSPVIVEVMIKLCNTVIFDSSIVLIALPVVLLEFKYTF
jgi:hypothetical protein